MRIASRELHRFNLYWFSSVFHGLGEIEPNNGEADNGSKLSLA
jgi:hypothetical protein